MAAVAYLDTHVVAWLYAGSRDLLSAAASGMIGSAGELRISPMVRLELQYLHEIGRLATPAGPVVTELGASLGLRMCDAPFAAVVLIAERQNWTRDPFDRMIVAQAAVHEARLVTRDGSILQHYDRAVW